jgi:enamine deaminase RidA (YjgF/YER057c/UK114 family)
MLKNYSICLPFVPGSLEEEWVQILEKLHEHVKAGNRLLKLNIFTGLPGYDSLINARGFIMKSVVEGFGESCPAISVTMHPPESPWKVAAEVMSAGGESREVSTRFVDETPYVRISTAHTTEIVGAGLCSDEWPGNTRKSAVAAFEKVLAILDRENMSMDNLVRQWNYIGNILQVSDGFQNYQTFNEVRNEYYSKYRSLRGYPAATGIGMMHGGVIIDFLAIAAKERLNIRPVDNPNQVNAYEYDQKVLKGLKRKGQAIKHAPQFERALMVINSKTCRLLISGTASIIGQKTIGKGDVKEQTIVTIENIKKLTDSERISQMTGNLSCSGGRFSLIRVYIRNSKDFEEVKKICGEHYPGVPAIYIEADICRDDLLVEIEAEYLP